MCGRSGASSWEYFGDEYVHAAKTAFDTNLFAHALRDHDRYRELGIKTPYIPWGIHPELLEPPAPGAAAALGEREGGTVTFYFPGSFLGRRKPIRKVVEAFQGAPTASACGSSSSAQVPSKDEFLERGRGQGPADRARARRRVPRTCTAPASPACNVCLAPSRWEGLGLPLHEATAFGLPIITNDKPPMSEMVLDGRSGLLVASVENGTTRSGVTAWVPDPAALTQAIERLGDPAELERMATESPSCASSGRGATRSPGWASCSPERGVPTASRTPRSEPQSARRQTALVGRTVAIWVPPWAPNGNSSARCL